MQPGTIVNRYGKTTGNYLAPVNTPIEMRALPPWTDFNNYHQYEVLQEFDVSSSVIAPYYEQPGGGIQYKSKVEINELLKEGILKEVEVY